MPAATPVVKANFMPSVVPDQNPLNPPHVGTLTIHAQPSNRAILTGDESITSADTSLVLVVGLQGPTQPPIQFQNRKKPRSGGIPAYWNTVNPASISNITQSGTYDVVLSITGDNDNSTVTVVSCIKRP